MFGHKSSIMMLDTASPSWVMLAMRRCVRNNPAINEATKASLSGSSIPVPNNETNMGLSRSITATKGTDGEPRSAHVSFKAFQHRSMSPSRSSLCMRPPTFSRYSLSSRSCSKRLISRCFKFSASSAASLKAESNSASVTGRPSSRRTRSSNSVGRTSSAAPSRMDCVKK